MYYRSAITGKIVSSVSVLDDIYGKGQVKLLVNAGTLQEVEDPDLIDMIKNGTGVAAVLRYRELNECGLLEAKTQVEAMRAAMEE